MPWVTIAWAVAILLVLSAGTAWILRPKPPKTPYRTESLTQGNITKSVSASGSLQALVTVQVGSQISGQITRVLVDFNDFVRKGQVMAVLDPQTYESRLRQAQAQIAAGQASVAQLQAQAEVARTRYERALLLFEKGIIAKAALESELANWKAAQANVVAGRANVASSRASLAAAEIDLGRTTILAPIDGVVVDRQIEPGQTVAASLSAPILFQIAQDLSKLEVKISVDEADIGQVRQGQQVRFTVDAYPDDNFGGVVTQVRKQPETSANVVAYTVIAQADNPGGKLLPGMTANADIVIEDRRNVLKIPASALRWTPSDARTSRSSGSGFPGVPPVRGQSGNRPIGGPASQGRSMSAGMLESLNLDASQKAKAEAIFAEARQKGQAAASSAADRQARRKAMRAAMETAFTRLEPILRADQRAQLPALRARMVQSGGPDGQGLTSGVVWVLKDGKPVPVAVMVGATDGSSTELVDRSGALKPGSEVITGGGPKAKVQARSPLSAGPRIRM